MDAGNNNRFLSPLQSVNGKSLSIYGLWSIVFATLRNSDADILRTSRKKRAVRQDRGKTQD